MSTPVASLASVSVARNSSVKTSTANGHRDGSGVIAALFTAGTSGSRIDSIRITAPASVVSDVVRLFINGNLYDELSVYAASAADGTVTLTYKSNYAPPQVLLLNAADVLGVSTHVGNVINVTAFGWDY